MSSHGCLPNARRPLLAALALTLILPAAPAAAGTLSTSSPPAGDATVLVGTGKRGAKPKVAKAPKGVVVLGAASNGRFAIAVVRPKGATGGAVKLKANGKLKAPTKLVGVFGASKTLSATVCKQGGAAAGLAKVIRAGALSAADAKALGAALQRRACGQQSTAADAALLQRLGLKVPAGAGGSPGPTNGVAGGGKTGGGKVATPSTWPGGKTPPPGGGGSGGGDAAGSCDDGVDNDGDGQIDFRGGTSVYTDPGCTAKGDLNENSEVPVSAECAQAAYVSTGSGQSQEAFAAVNTGCGEFTDLTVSVAPGAVGCTAMTGDNSWSCSIANGAIWAFPTFTTSTAKEIVDMPITLTGPVDCSKPAVIAMTGTDLVVRELVEPISKCGGGGGGGTDAQCANGIDDDGDGQIDARQKAGATDPDPGCSGTTDTSESSEIAAPIGCDLQGGFFGGDPRMTGMLAIDCGTLTGAWFKAPGTPASCAYKLGAAAEATCTVSGAVGFAEFAATTAELRMITPITADADCRPVTIALQRSDGQVIELRESWC